MHLEESRSFRRLILCLLPYLRRISIGEISSSETSQISFDVCMRFLPACSHNGYLPETERDWRSLFTVNRSFLKHMNLEVKMCMNFLIEFFLYLDHFESYFWDLVQNGPFWEPFLRPGPKWTILRAFFETWSILRDLVHSGPFWGYRLLIFLVHSKVLS